MSLKRSPLTQALGVLGRASLGAGLLALFLSGALSSIVLYANLPAGRRIVALALQRALNDTFEGTFSIGTVERVSLTQLRARDITAQDGDRHLVLSLDTLSVQADLPALLHQLLFGVGTVTLRIDHASADRAEVYLQPGQQAEVPSIADAFKLKSKAPGRPPLSDDRRTLYSGYGFPRLALRRAVFCATLVTADRRGSEYRTGQMGGAARLDRAAG